MCAGPRRIRATWKLATKEAEEEEAGPKPKYQNKYNTNTTQIRCKRKGRFGEKLERGREIEREREGKKERNRH